MPFEKLEHECWTEALNRYFIKIGLGEAIRRDTNAKESIGFRIYFGVVRLDYGILKWKKDVQNANLAKWIELEGVTLYDYESERRDELPYVNFYLDCESARLREYRPAMRFENPRTCLEHIDDRFKAEDVIGYLFRQIVRYSHPLDDLLQVLGQETGLIEMMSEEMNLGG